MSMNEDGRPWWREPWPWILMAGPAAAIVGCAITIVLAVQNFSNEPILDGGIKKGLVVSKHVPASKHAPVTQQPGNTENIPGARQ